jgi:hypothetical protein
MGVLAGPSCARLAVWAARAAMGGILISADLRSLACAPLAHLQQDSHPTRVGDHIINALIRRLESC